MSHWDFLSKRCENMLQRFWLKMIRRLWKRYYALMQSPRKRWRFLGTETQRERHASAVFCSQIHWRVTFIGVLGRCTGQVWKLQSVDVETVKTIIPIFGGNKHPLASKLGYEPSLWVHTHLAGCVGQAVMDPCRSHDAESRLLILAILDDCKSAVGKTWRNSSLGWSPCIQWEIPQRNKVSFFPPIGKL